MHSSPGGAPRVHTTVSLCASLVILAVGRLGRSESGDDRPLERKRWWRRRGSNPVERRALTQGNIYVADDENDRIQKFSPDGSFLGEWVAAEPGQPSLGVRAVAVGPDGSVWVAASEMLRFTTDGVFLSSWTSTPRWITDLAVDGSGSVYVARPQDHCFEIHE